jgi:uncharacterized membrane protein
MHDEAAFEAAGALLSLSLAPALAAVDGDVELSRRVGGAHAGGGHAAAIAASRATTPRGMGTSCCTSCAMAGATARACSIVGLCCVDVVVSQIALPSHACLCVL